MLNDPHHPLDGRIRASVGKLIETDRSSFSPFAYAEKFHGEISPHIPVIIGRIRKMVDIPAPHCNIATSLSVALQEIHCLPRDATLFFWNVLAMEVQRPWQLSQRKPFTGERRTHSSN